MTEQKSIGVIGLENLMSRANIIFTSGYLFRGTINIHWLQQSFIEVVDCITKFEYRLHSHSQNQFHWQKSGPFRNRFLVIESDDIEEAFKDLSANSFKILEDSNHYPMVMAVIQHSDRESNQEFIIAQLSDHVYTDAGSSEVIFNKVIDYYNALAANDVEKTSDILEATRKIKTIDAEAMVELLKETHFDHEGNLDKLSQYPIADVGEHKVPLATIPEYLKTYKQRVRKPIIHYFNITRLIERCRNTYPEVTKNSAVCAVLAKGIYNLNVKLNNKPEEHIISFKMLSNILPNEMRQQYSGNYISFVPVTVNGHETLEEIAKDIHERIREFKTTQLNLSMFSLVEDAVNACAVGENDEELSFIVTNWNNYTFLNNPDYLTGCHSLKHISGVNIEPRDTLGGALVNRPVMTICLSPGDQLCLSFFPSLRSDDEHRTIVEYIDKVFGEL